LESFVQSLKSHQEIKAQNFEAIGNETCRMNVSNLPKGIYTFEIRVQKARIRKRVVVK
jgi:hypothetical protein